MPFRKISPTDRLDELVSRTHVPPGNAVWIDEDDQLVLSVSGSVAGVVVGCSGKVLTLEGDILPFEGQVALSSDRSTNTLSLRVGRGMLLSCVVRVVSGAPAWGQAWASLISWRGGATIGIPDAALLLGYFSAGQPLSYPYPTKNLGPQSVGNMRNITGTDPAAGAEVSETVPTGARWKLWTVRVTFVTSATVANRLPMLTLDDGTTEFFRASVNTAAVAATTTQLTWAAFGYKASTGAISAEAAIPLGIMLLGGYRIRTLTQLIDVADNYSAPQLFVEEFLEK